MFEWVLLVHVSSVTLSFVLFFVRGLWLAPAPGRAAPRILKVLPHIVDTVLLASGATLAVLIRQYPFVDPWLTAKLVGLVVYIALGMVALHRGRRPALRLGAWIAAMCVFGYIVSVALTMNPAGFLVFMGVA